MLCILHFNMEAQKESATGFEKQCFSMTQQNTIIHLIKQIRTALVIASLLRITLVMPPLWCRLDRPWFPHPGVLEGTMTKQPFLCPLDHVNAMLRELSEEEFGPGINSREHSILDNPSLPEEVKKSWLDVHLCQEGTHGCNASNDSAVGGVLRIPRNSNEDTFIKVFSAFKDVKVIQFSSMQNAFTGFADKGREDRFRRRVKRYMGIWCCVLDHIPSHIYYDMYWDEKPAWMGILGEIFEDGLVFFSFKFYCLTGCQDGA